MSSSSGMQGPARPTRGSRFSGGYQFPRTDQQSYRRERPLRVVALLGGACAEIVPLVGSGGRLMFDVCGRWTARGGDGEPVHVSSSTIVLDQLEATVEFTRLVREIERA